MVQSGRLDLRRLRLLAKREKADAVLCWLVTQIPEPEVTSPVRDLRQFYALEPPRGGARVNYRYDFGRLIKRPAGRDGRWRATRS